jgi:hypothetical protein
MQLLALTTDLALQAGQLLAAGDPTPEAEDVKAGWTAFAIFIGLIIAVALLGYFLTKQLKRTEANRKAGAFGPVEDEAEEPTENGAEPRA